MIMNIISITSMTIVFNRRLSSLTSWIIGRKSRWMTRSSVRPGTHPALMSRYQQKKQLVYYGHSLIDWFDQVCSLEHIPRLYPGISRTSNWFIMEIHWLIDLIKCVPWNTSRAFVQVSADKAFDLLRTFTDWLIINYIITAGIWFDSLRAQMPIVTDRTMPVYNQLICVLYSYEGACCSL